jgi:hypothetical protein
MFTADFFLLNQKNPALVAVNSNLETAQNDLHTYKPVSESVS